MKILVSGVGGDIGFGVGRILKNWGAVSKLVGADMHQNHPGNALFDQCVLAPPAHSADYLPWLEGCMLGNEIDLFIPTSEAEIKVASKLLDKGETTLPILVNSAAITTLCFDKYETMRLLDSRGIAVPQHGLVGKGAPTSFPVIVKPRWGSGSDGIMRVETEEYLQTHATDGHVWQEYLYPENMEFTCAVYADSEKAIRMLVMKRELRGGITYRAEIVHDQVIEDYVADICQSLSFSGCINIQLRKTEKGPRIFEINPRLSSTVVFRDLLGFQDLRWWIADFFSLQRDEYAAPKAGTRIFRGDKEYIAEPG